MFCSNCGNQNPDNINYCATCGSKLREVPEYADVNNYQTNNFSAINIAPTDAKTFRRFAREKLAGKWGTAALLMLIYTLCSVGISLASIFIPFVGGLATIAIAPVLSFGLLVLWIKLKNGENINFLDFFTIGFSNFANVWGVLLRTALKFIVPIIIFAVSMLVIPICTVMLTMLAFRGFESASIIMAILSIIAVVANVAVCILCIPRYYKYMFVLNELAYSPSQSAKDLVECSGNFMMGKRLGAFWLALTFIGWILLSVFVCYVPLVFINSEIIRSLLGSLIVYIPFLWLTPYMQIANIIYYEWASNRLNG